MNRKISYYGLIPDLPDNRDFPCAATGAPAASFESRPRCLPVSDQGQLGRGRKVHIALPCPYLLSSNLAVISGQSESLSEYSVQPKEKL